MILEFFVHLRPEHRLPRRFSAAINLRGFDFGQSRQSPSEVRQLDLESLKRVLRSSAFQFGDQLHDFKFVWGQYQ